ncbi:hypothetical protein BD324DRAFT_613166 [Kockovaella imperatae]|uniref:NADH:ubiquinone oxidoreductase intermediate-associated protein 30 domain-containing protein n=1 Tax=Kockovaella imperatae TaxID=4999 RepID=A0A1Y1USW1_9TREE|nr:hypothetical protein BD324DRAFT_613166 [Kockovaella imperatae]ORX41098.1 hypothetical protein BD324DRAFT_613166 [Kockovaella imperatae]
MLTSLNFWETVSNGRSTIPPFTMYSFSSDLPPLEPPTIMALGADSDIGGLSTSNATSIPTAAFYDDPGPSSPLSFSSDQYENSVAVATGSHGGGISPGHIGSPSAGPSRPALKRDPNLPRITGSHMSHVALHGNMSLRLPPSQMGKIRTGYVGMRNHFRPTILGGEDAWDLRQYTHIKMQIAYRGWEGWRKRWYCNVQIAGPTGPSNIDVYQLRIELPPSSASTSSRAPLDPFSGVPPRWTTLHLPLSSFVLTNMGSTSPVQVGMDTEGVRSVGFSLLGGGRDNQGLPLGQPGQYLSQKHRDLSQVEDLDPAFNASRAKRRRHRDGTMDRERGGDGHPGGMDRVSITPFSEGYYELCVRYVQAVQYDPMTDDRPSEWDVWEEEQRLAKERQSPWE